MTRLRLFACMLSALAAWALARPVPACAWLGSGPAEPKESTALLWVPEMSSLDWKGLENLLEKYEDARFSLALIPGAIPEEAKAWLRKAVDSGQVEPVLRLPGDPILPLIPDSQFRAVIEHLALGRAAHKAVFGAFPEGIVPGGGALTPALAAPMSAQQLTWAAVGDEEFKRPWFGEGRMRLVPFRLAVSTDAIDNIQTAAPALVLDERNGLPPGSGLRLITELMDRASSDRWTSVAAALDLQNPYAVGPKEWPTFGGGLSRWRTEGKQAAAWKLLDDAAQALSDYQNSGSAMLSTLNRAGKSLYAALDSRFFTAAALESPARDKEFRGLLIKVFHAIGKRTPRSLKRPLAGSGTPAPEDVETEAAEEAPPLAEEKRLRTTTGEDRLFFENPQESSAALPSRTPELPPGTTPQHLWTPRSLEIVWNEESVRFSIGMDALFVSLDAPFGFDHLLVDLYIDLNHLARRGSTRLLPYRRGFMNSSDAWEFAVVLSGWSAGLYRSIPGHPPRLIERLPLEGDMETKTLSVSVPRSRLRGNPAAWGYMLAAMAADPQGRQRHPPLPLPGDHGTAILGILGHAGEQQKLGRGTAARKPFTAVRVEQD